MLFLFDNCFFIGLPLAPVLNPSAVVVKQTFLTIISWVPRDDANSSLGYSIDCFRCKSLQDKDCRGLCSQNVKFQPGRDIFYTVNVTVVGLQSGSIYLFRVYSVNELNQREKDRDKWNFATVYVQTKGKKFFTVVIRATSCGHTTSESSLSSLSSSYSSPCYRHRRDHDHQHRHHSWKR